MGNIIYKHYDEVIKYANDIKDGNIPANKYQKLGVERFFEGLEDKRYDFKPRDAEFIIQFIETLTVHQQGQTLSGEPLLGKPFLLEPFHKYVIYNLFGFYIKGTKERRFKEAFIFWPRKNIKTSFSAALALATAVLERKSGSKVYIVASVLKQALESFSFIENSILSLGKKESEKYRIRSYNGQYSIERKFNDGSLYIQALASNPDKQDSLNMNVAIADEIHAYKSAKQYNVIKEGMKAYTNKLMIGITTAGDNIGSFCYNRLIYCKGILDKKFKDDTYFIFIAEADADELGVIDFTNPKVHAEANPAYGVSIRPADIQNDANQALNDPQQRKDFLAKSLNVYTSSIKAWFTLEEFQKSDELFDYGFENPLIINDEEFINYEEISKLDIEWFGGADLSVMHDLTAASLYGRHTLEDGTEVTIIIPHAWFPITRQAYLQDDLGIPYESWEDTGWLSFVNGEVIEYDDVVKWFMEFRDLGFNIKTIGYDPHLAKEFSQLLEREDFDIKPIGQQYWNKSKGFRDIEYQMKRNKLYYCHSEAYEYCVSNVKGIEDPEERVRFEKTSETQKIDIFDASVAAACAYIEDKENDEISIDDWF